MSRVVSYGYLDEYSFSEMQGLVKELGSEKKIREFADTYKQSDKSFYNEDGGIGKDE